jgi:hypothetical protein
MRHPGAMVISYEVPFNSWVDMTHLLPRENCRHRVRASSLLL